MKKKFVAIGHITCDTEPTPHMGGSAAYAAVAACRLGYEAHIVTKSPQNHPFIEELEKVGIYVHILPSKLNTITTFKNTYDETGRRTQVVLAKQEDITLVDIKKLNESLFTDSIILIASVIGEVEQKVFQALRPYKFSLTPQGYFRSMGSNGAVKQVMWKHAAEFVECAQAVIFSEEDITIHGKKDNELLDVIQNHSLITVLTEGEKGACVFRKDTSFHTNAFSLKPTEIKDFTGAGDTFATQFLLEYSSHHNLKRAAQEACLFAAIKIMGMNGIGIESIPTLQEVETFKAKHGKRINEWLAKQE